MSLILHSLFLFRSLTFSPRSPLTWLVATWIATVDVKADMTGAETKLRRKPEKRNRT